MSVNKIIAAFGITGSLVFKGQKNKKFYSDFRFRVTTSALINLLHLAKFNQHNIQISDFRFCAN